MKALVTAGGTTQPIDDVRNVGNISGGGFGTEIARTLSACGVETTLLGSKQCIGRLRREEPFEAKSFMTFEDLQQEMTGHIESEQPDIIFMAAAVSDYTPERHDGKLSSASDELSIRMKRLPKILPTLRELAGKQCFIAGFKLLSGVSEERLREVALEQNKLGRLNLTVANLVEGVFGSPEHPALLVTPEGGAIPVGGTKAEVARQLVDFVLMRHQTRWFKTVHLDGKGGEEEVRTRTGRLLSFAQQAHLLVDSSGNVSSRGNHGHLVVSPRGLDKSAIQSQDLCVGHVDTENRKITCWGDHRSSIDTGVQGVLYSLIDDMQSVLHFHPGNALVLPQFQTMRPMPCGTVEEASEIHQALIAGGYQGGSFMMEMVHHGYLLGLAPGDEKQMFLRWEETLRMHDKHLEGLGEVEQPAKRAPLFSGVEIVGLIAHLHDGAVSLWLRADARGDRLGYQFVKQVIERELLIAAHDGCGVKEFYESRGFEEVTRKGSIVTLRPPTLREDVIQAATVTLFHPPSGEVLIGVRNAEPWKGCYAFPGGKLELGETHREAAERELLEETGITMFIPEQVVPTILYTAKGSKVFCVRNYVIPIWTKPTAVGSGEIECEWRRPDPSLNAGWATRYLLKGF